MLTMTRTMLLLCGTVFLGCSSSSSEEATSKPVANLNSPPQNLAMEASPASAAQALAESRPVATQSLQTLVQLAAKGQYKALGFSTAEEAKGAAIGNPVIVRMVRLDQLRSYKPGDDPAPLTSSVSPRVIYPVNVNEQLRSSVTVARANEKWQAASFGPDPVLNLMSHGPRRAGGENQAVVTVPALGFAFLAEGEGADMRLTPLQDYPKADLKAGQTLPAAQAFERLSKVAREADGLPI